MHFFTLTATFLSAFVVLSSAIPVAEPIEFPEAIRPRSPAPSALSFFAKRSTCHPQGIKCDVGAARSCADYLYNKGTTPCTVSSTGTTMCGAGNCVVQGRSQRADRADTSSYCRDVAIGLRNIVDGCQTGSVTGGVDAANGNGYMLINLVRQ